MALASPAHALLTQEFSDTAERLQRSTVQVRSGQAGSGSGVIWSPDGLVVTNAHVARTPRVQVELSDGREITGEVTSTDTRRDLAAVKIDASDLPAAPVSSSDLLRVGQLVVAVGNPLGMSGAMTVGIIHAIAPSGGVGHQMWVQADVHLAPGNSGGPLADVLGRVVGINSMISGGLGLAVPSNDVRAFLEAQGRRIYLGVTTQGVFVPRDGSRVRGLLVLAVEPGSAALRAGLQVGDVLIGSDGHAFGDPRELSRAIHEAAPDGALSLHVLRGGKPARVDVSLVPTSGLAVEKREAA